MAGSAALDNRGAAEGRSGNYGGRVRYRLTDQERLDACGENPGVICEWVADRTDSVGLTQAADLLLDKPFQILIIVVVAFVISRLLRRIINSFVRRFARRSLAGIGKIERRTPRPTRRHSERRHSEHSHSDHGQPEHSELERSELERWEDAAEERLQHAKNGRAELRIDTLVAVLSSLSTVVVWATAAIMILGLFNVSLAPLFASAGVVGVALGFGALSVVADFLSGFFMLFEDQYGVGDVVDVGEVSGTVENLSLRTTTLRDVNGTVWHIRNSEIRRVGNKSQLWSRAVLDIDVAYDTDIRRAEGIIQRVANELWQDTGFTDGDIIDPPEVWGVERLGADGVAIRLVVKTDPAEQWIVGRELRLRIKEALDEAGIEIPFPQRTIWLRQDEAVPRELRPQVEVAPLRVPEPTEEMVDNPGS